MKPHPKHRLAFSTLVGAVVIGASLVMSATPTAAQHGKHNVIQTGDLEFKAGPPTLPEGAHFAVLLGNPAEEGPFVIRLKLPAGYDIPPHFHPEEEHVTVISGGFGMAMGETHDRSAAPVLVPDNFVQIPKGAPHFAWAEEKPSFRINAIGPFGIEYVDPKDDPRTN